MTVCVCATTVCPPMDRACRTTPHLVSIRLPAPLRAPAAAGRHTAARDEGRTVIISADPGLGGSREGEGAG